MTGDCVNFPWCNGKTSIEYVSARSEEYRIIFQVVAYSGRLITNTNSKIAHEMFRSWLFDLKTVRISLENWSHALIR